MTKMQFRAYKEELDLTNASLASALGISEISVKRYATGTQDVSPSISISLKALVLLSRLGKLDELKSLS